MNIKCAAISIFMVLIFPLSAISAEWRIYFESANGSNSYIDTKSVNHLKNGNVRAWTKYTNKDGNGTLSSLEINCEERSYTVRAMEPTGQSSPEIVSALNAVVKGWSEPTQVWEYLSTSELAEKEYEIFCK